MLRLLNGLTQMELAKGIGVTFQQIQKYERAENRISASTLIKISDFLKVSPMALLSDEIEKSLKGGLSKDEIQLIRDYRKANDHIKNAAKNVLRQ